MKTTRTTLLLAAFLATTLACGPVGAQECLEYGDYIHQVGVWDNPEDSSYSNRFHLCHAGELVAVANSFSLNLIDVSDPANPTAAGSCTVYDSNNPSYYELSLMAYREGFIYLFFDDFLQVVQIQGVSQPTLVNQVALPYGYGTSIGFYGDYAYLTLGSLGTFLLDVSDPSAPLVLSSTTDTGTQSRLTIAGSRLYQAGNNGVFHVFDLADDPTVPAPVGFVGLPGNSPRQITANGNLVLITDAVQGLQIVDVTTPSSPVLRSTLALGKEPYGLSSAGTLALVSHNWDGMSLVDLGSPDAPVLSAQPDGNSYANLMDGGLAYVAARAPMFSVLDISSGEMAPTLGQIPTLSSYGSYDYLNFTTAGSLGYLGLGSTFAVVDLSVIDPEEPAILQQMSLGGYIKDIVVHEGFAYVSNSYYGLQVFDLSQPAAPLLVGSAYAPGYPRNLAVAADRVYLAGDEAGLTIFNVEDPTDPYISGWHGGLGHTSAVAVAGSRLVVADDYGALLVMDIADPDHPVLLGLTGIPGSFDLVGVQGDIAFTAGGDDFTTVDLSDPLRPEVLDSITVATGITDILISGTHAYVSSYDWGVTILDISDPQAISPVGIQAGGGEAFGTAVVDGNLIILGRYALTVAALQCEEFSFSPGQGPVASRMLLQQNYPNPFNPSTTICYQLDAAQPVSLRIFDVAGRLVHTLVDGEVLAPGDHEAVWTGRDQGGRQTAAGIYFYELATPQFKETRRMTLLK